MVELRSRCFFREVSSWNVPCFLLEQPIRPAVLPEPGKGQSWNKNLPQIPLSIPLFWRVVFLALER
jgi:hypothetical protein